MEAGQKLEGKHSGGLYTENREYGQPGWPSGLALLSAHGGILETRNRVPRQAPFTEPASPSARLSLSLCLS